MCWVLEGVCLQLVHNYRMAQPMQWAPAILDYMKNAKSSIFVRKAFAKKLAFRLSELEKRPKWLECQGYPTGQRKQDVGMCKHVHSTSDS